jgi:hypothetical protein
MTWRAFILGLLAVAGIALLEPYVSHAKGWGGFSSTSFPGGAVLVLVLFTVGLNALLRLARRGLELSRPELMLVWCMLIVGATFPGDGIARFWYSFTAAGPYMARRADLAWEEDGALTHAPEKLVLSTNPRSFAAKRYFEGTGERGRVPWGYWLTPLLHWALFFVALYGVVFCLMAILRRQWVESERLMFPLARVPLEFTEEKAGGGFLPRLFSEKGFIVGLIFALAFRLFRALPLFFGADGAIPLALPMKDIFAETPLEPMNFDNINLWPSAVGFAFLVPADVSLSVWFFYFFARFELQTVHWLGMGEYGSTYGRLMRWQQAGAYVTFAAVMLFMARRHIWAVVRRGFLRSAPDDSDEPISYFVAFWGLLLSLAGCMVWYWYHTRSLLGPALMLGMILVWYLVYARMVAQAGVYVGRTIWRLMEFTHGITGGQVINAPAAVVGSMQDTIFVTGGTAFLAPMAINAFRISEVFRRRRRRLLVPALMVAFLVAMVCGTYTALNTANDMGAANMRDTWGQQNEPRWRFDVADRVIKQPAVSAQAYPGPLIIGVVSMALLSFMRARFYWWPIHPIGLLTCSSWHAHRLWLPFFLGWLTKMGIMKVAGGGRLRDARYFFIALIIVEAFVGGISTIVRTISAGSVPGF